MKQIEVQSAGITDTGLLRSDNQDQFFVADFTHSMLVRSGSLDVVPRSRLFGSTIGHLFFVADGMGGHRAGNEASMLAIQYFVNAVLNRHQSLIQTDSQSEESLVEDLENILMDAHRTIKNQSKRDQNCAGMGTTLTMAYVSWPKMVVVHAGDTRCYLMRGSDLRLITRDHTVADQMLQAGRLEPDSLEHSHWSNVLVNALGAGANEVFAEIHKLDLESGDAILLCSDGLNKHVTDIQICQYMLDNKDPSEACANLVQLAKQGGGSDNITVVIARFVEPNRTPARMQVLAANPTEERIFQDVPIPETDLDTTVEDEDAIPEIDTGDFCESKDHATGESHERM